MNPKTGQRLKADLDTLVLAFYIDFHPGMRYVRAVAINVIAVML
jgi:hypothetical protein